MYSVGFIIRLYNLINYFNNKISYKIKLFGFYSSLVVCDKEDALVDYECCKITSISR